MIDRSPPLTVLVVDNERIIADTLVIILKSNGFVAVAAYSGEEAIEVVPRVRPDVLITDVIMETVSGIELAMHVHNHLPNCKVLLISGQATTARLLDDAKKTGFDFPILAKPVHPRAILQFLASCAAASNDQDAGPNSADSGHAGG